MRLPGRDIPWKDFLKAVKEELKKDNISDAAGSLTYFGVLAVFPFLLFLVSLASVIIEPAQARILLEELAKVAPREVTAIMGDQLQKLVSDQKVGLLSIGALGAIWAASNGVMAVMRAFNTAYGVKESRPFWKTRLIAIGFTLGGGALGLAATAAAIAAPGVAEAVGGPLGTAILWLRIPVAALLVMFVWAVAYYVLPDVEQEFKFITPGSVLGVVIWIIASLGFSLYVTNFGSYDATYGALGGVIVMLLWMWISSQVLLLGAEVNAIIEQWSPEGKDPGEKTMDGSVREPTDQVKAETGEPVTPTKTTRDPKLASSPSHQTFWQRNTPGPKPERRPQERGAAGKLVMVLWGAVMGAAIMRLRRRPA